MTLATTTSTRDSGLLDVLLPMFRASSGIEVRVVAVGTGQALALGRRGDADALLTHDPEGEAAFVREGHGLGRLEVFSGDFVLVGPADDPGGIRSEPSAAAAFARVARLGLPFLSRGDDSGTHRKERAVWRGAGVEPSGPWYSEAGTGMGPLLRMAAEKRAYALSDRATFEAQGRGLAIVSEGDPALANPYAYLVVDPARHPGVRTEEARRLGGFLRSPEARAAIAGFRPGNGGRPPFHVPTNG